MRILINACGGVWLGDAGRVEVAQLLTTAVPELFVTTAASSKAMLLTTTALSA